MTTGVMQKVLQLSFSDQLVQIVLEVPTVLRGMSVVLVVLAIKVLITPCGLSRILFGHLKYGSFLIFSNTRCTGS